MDTFLTVISFPFWFIGAVCVITGIFGAVKVDGVPYRGEYRLPIKAGVTAMGLVSLAVAYSLVIVI